MHNIVKTMSEWKNNLDNEISGSYNDDTHCTGWGIIDGVIACIKGIKKRRQRKKQAKIK